MIRRCSCPATKSPAAAFQEARYNSGGQTGNRVFTEAKIGGKSRCTVCGDIWIVTPKNG